jgi:hypothetical protein
MTDDDWRMADGFAPASRVMYCQHPKACSAPTKGKCSRCQLSPRLKAAFHRHNKAQTTVLATASSVPTYLDPDFDELGV